MNWPKGAKVATDALRTYAMTLQLNATKIQTLREHLDASRVPQAAWGVSELKEVGYRPGGKPGDTIPKEPEVADALPELRTFRTAYEIAHAGIIVRMGQLRDLCDNAADALDATAKGYDITDMRELEVSSSSRTSERSDDSWTRPGDDREPVADATPEGHWRSVREMLPEDTMIETGFGDMIPLVDAYLEVDGYALKAIGLTRYGHSDEAIADIDMDEEGESIGIQRKWGRLIPNPLNVFDSPWSTKPLRTEPDQWFLNTAPIPHMLSGVGQTLISELRDLEKKWEGDAFEAFDRYINELAKQMTLEAARIRKVGTALFNLGDTLMNSSKNVEDEIKGAYKKLTAGLDVVNTIKNIDPTFPITQMVEGILDIHEKEQQESAEQARIARGVQDASVGISERVITAPSPAEVMDNMDDIFLPTDPDEWEWKDAQDD